MLFCYGSGNQVMILITGAQKSFALYKTIEEGVNHMWTASALQQHATALLICDDDATLELRVKTVKYFKVRVTMPSNKKCCLISLLLKSNTALGISCLFLNLTLLQGLMEVHSKLIDGSV